MGKLSIKNDMLFLSGTDTRPKPLEVRGKESKATQIEGSQVAKENKKLI